MDATIRQMRDEDRDQLVEMARALIQETPYRGQIVGEESQLHVLFDLVTRRGAVWVAEVEGRVVGMIGALTVVIPVVNRRVGTEVAWWVDPKVRGTGPGLALLQVAEEWARAEGAVAMQIAVHDNVGLEQVCRRRGYRPQEVVYEKELEQWPG